FGGMRDHGDTLTFAPRLPEAITRMSFGLIYRGRLIRVTYDAGETRYELRDGEPIELIHHGERFELDREARTFPNPPVPEVPPVSPPTLREPCRRGIGWEGREAEVPAMSARG